MAGITPPVEPVSGEEAAAKSVQRRYEGLVMVRNKAVKGKGAWYWAHLEPLLVHNADTALPKAVKLRCALCDAVFSASNPSRTASEHLKRGTCPNFNSSSAAAKPISSVSPPSALPPPHHNHRKRASSDRATAAFQAPPISAVDPPRFCAELTYSPAVSSTTVAVLTHPPQPQHLLLSGGKEDLVALAMLEDSVKKLKSPKTSPGPTLSKTQIDSAFDFLADWVYESCGSVSFSSLEHPKFRAFLSQVGLPAISRRDIAGPRLDAKYEEARAESDARIRDAMFFQIACDGWKPKNHSPVVEDNLVSLSVNLPNGTGVYRRALFVSGSVPSKFAEEVLWETISGICGNVVQQCVGIVSDRFQSKALRVLENQNPWMVNVSCQLQAFNSLIKDFTRELPLFKSVSQNCLRLASFVNNNSQVRNSFRKYQLQEYGRSELLRLPLRDHEKSFGPVLTLLEDILSSVNAVQMVLMDDSVKLVCMEDPLGREVEEMVRDLGFWSDLDAVRSLVKLVKDMAQEIEDERPLVGQCLPLWDELRGKVKDWCSKFRVAEGLVEKVIERRFKKNYHPAWAAAFILDPLHLIRDTSGKYLPPYRTLTTEQEKDVDKLITRLVSREEAHIAVMELMKWKTEGLNPVYARAVQMRERDTVSGKMKIANPQSSRLVWETYLTEFKSLGKVAVRLIFLHATARGFKCNWSFLRWVSAHGQTRALIDRAQKLVFLAAHSKLEKRDMSTDEDKDAEFFALANGEGNVLNEVLVDTSSM